MKRLLLVVSALAALMISVPAAMARDANRDALRQEGKAITALQKQQEARFNAINVEAAKSFQRLEPTARRPR